MTLGAPIGIALTIAATWKLTLGQRIIARGDLLLYFYPLRDYASQAIREGRQNEIMYHVGRPGEDGFTERVLAALDPPWMRAAARA